MLRATKMLSPERSAYDVPARAHAAATSVPYRRYGPTVVALRGVDPAVASRLRDELTRLFQEHNHAVDGTTVVAAEYLDVQARVA